MESVTICLLGLLSLRHEEVNATVERLLAEFERGNLSDGDLMAALNKDIRKLAQMKLRGERANHTLQATEVANLVCLRVALNPQGLFALNDVPHLIHLLGKLIDNVLPDHARRKTASALGVSPETVKLDVRKAKAFVQVWLMK